MTTEHTPEPWRVDRHNIRCNETPDNTGTFVAEMQSSRGIEQCAADARLIAAAPALLKALRETLHVLVTPFGLPDKGRGRTDEQQRVYDSARAAIAQATTDPGCTCEDDVPINQPMPNYCPVHDGDYSDWLCFNNID